MTNLIPSARRRWINRGRVLVGLPIACGLFLSSLLFLLVLRPIWQDVQELERRRDSLLNLHRNLPVLEQQLEKETVVLAQVEHQQALLIGLILQLIQDLYCHRPLPTFSFQGILGASRLNLNG